MMQIGLLTSILDGWTFEEAAKLAFKYGFSCLEVACWPSGKAERRYAGVSHIDAERVLADDAYTDHIREVLDKNNIRISSLAYYPNILDKDEEKGLAAKAHLENVIKASGKLGVNMVTTFIGRDQYKTVEENLKLVRKAWPPILALAESLHVRIAIENCPMLFGKDEWPGGQNLMCTPVLFRKIFEILPSDNLGLNFDPSHFVWQGLDYLAAVREFKDKLFHIHFKDIKLYPERLKDCGCLAYPLEYMAPKIPGRGDVDWRAFAAALKDAGFAGDAVLEIEDKDFEGSREDILEAVRLAADAVSFAAEAAAVKKAERSQII